MKICRRCTTEKPMVSFYVNRARSDGRNSVCRECLNAERTTFITCQKCSVEKASNQFYLSINRDRRMSVCSECYGPSPTRTYGEKPYRPKETTTADPVDYKRIRSHLAATMKQLPSDNRKLVEIWNDHTDFILPRNSTKDLPLKVIGEDHPQKETKDVATADPRTQALQELSNYFGQRGPNYSSRD
jgi:hypothetical protein